MSSQLEPQQPVHRLTRRQLLVGAAVAGLGAVLAAEAANRRRAVAEPLPDDLRLRHLLRRAGFGASPRELEQYGRLGLSGTVNQLVEFDQVDNSALEQRLERLRLNLDQRADLERWWLLRMAYTARPLEEKLVLFWHGLLTSAISKVGRAAPMLAQNRFLRLNALGRFPDLLKGISRDPAMMLWLDLQTNRKGHPNENYARELMELFALGIGNYTEQDIREAARAYTGWGLRGLRGHQEFTFLKQQHDDGDKVLFGQTGRFDGDDVVDAVVRQPASARFIARRLFAFFAYPDPSDDALKPLVDAYVSSGYSIKALVRAILTSDAFYSPAAYRALIKSPVDYVVGTIRCLDIETDGKGLPLVAAQLGQELFNPPNVAGWPGGRSWLNSGTWLARLNFANRVAGGMPSGLAARLQPLVGDPASAFHVAGGPQEATTPEAVVDHLANALLDGRMESGPRQVILDYLTPGPGAALSDERRRGAVYLTLAMPEYHLM
jgi:uncharacterized protein (DUF1800 family)